MANHLRIPMLNPFKFVPNTSNPGRHFDDSWHCEQIRSWETRATYKQKWQRADKTPLYMESSIAPDDLIIYNLRAIQVKTIPWVSIFSSPDYSIYKLEFDVTDLPDDEYCLYQRVALLDIDWDVISEPFILRDFHRNTVLIRYTNSRNDWDVAFKTGIEFCFRIEGDVMDADFKRERASYANQIRSVKTLSGMPYRVFKFYIGEAPGVAPWTVDLLNRIFVCDTVWIQDKRFETEIDSEWEVTRVKGYPLIGAQIEVVEVADKLSAGYSQTENLAEGIVTAYNIETAFFGGGTIVPVIDVEKE